MVVLCRSSLFLPCDHITRGPSLSPLSFAERQTSLHGQDLSRSPVPVPQGWQGARASQGPLLQLVMERVGIRALQLGEQPKEAQPTPARSECPAGGQWWPRP
jgi:hypothetical protein